MTVSKHLDQTKNAVKAIVNAEYPVAVEDLTFKQVEGTSIYPRRINGLLDRRYALELKANKRNGDFNGLSVMNAMDGFKNEQPFELSPCRGGYFLLGTAGDLVALQDMVRERQKAVKRTR